MRRGSRHAGDKRMGMFDLSSMVRSKGLESTLGGLWLLDLLAGMYGGWAYNETACSDCSYGAHSFICQLIGDG